MKFHDGSDLTPEDVVFSVQRITDADFGSPQLSQFATIASAEVMDDNRVKLTTNAPYPALMGQLVKLSIVPQAIVEEMGDGAFNQSPVGSGPYIFDGWDRGIEVRLTRNDDYWGDVGSFPAAVFRAVLAFTRWPRYARVAYGQTLGLLNLPYVRLAHFMGASTPRILIRHILPNIIGPIMVVVTLEFGLMVLFEAGLSFLGLGVQPPTASWGAILSAGRNYVTTAWWIAVFPGLFLFLLILSVNVLGDHVRDVVEGRR